MAKLSISNIGPITNIDITLNRLNVLIGPQSSGKSTVAKILSFCHWMEKDCIIRQTIEHIDYKYIEDKLIRYYNISDYFTPDARFHYEGDYLTVDYLGGNVQVKTTENFNSALSSKNAYIPSERNVIGIPGIFSTKMPENYLLEFIDDWQQIRLKYSMIDTLSILNLGGCYFYNSSEGADMIKTADGNSIHFSQASSGIQSATPLCVCIDYLTQWIYSHTEDSSAELRQLRRNASLEKALLDLKESDSDLFNELANKGYRADDVIKHIYDLAKSEDKDLKLTLPKSEIWMIKLIAKVLATDKRLSHSDHSNIVVEEPEQNLFPETQVQLIYYILSKINKDRDNLLITTHSPYILYALNNCMLANFIYRDADSSELEGITNIPENAFVNPEYVSVWELDKGSIRGEKTIQDDNGMIRGNYFDRVMQNVMADFHNLLTLKK